MPKTIRLMTVLLLVTLANVIAYAQQDKEKKEAEKPQTSTVDAWRNALPVNEQPSPNSTVANQSNQSESVETAAEIEGKVLDLEKKMMVAVKGRDSATLKSLLADDFLLAGMNIPGAKSDKIRYINWAVKSLELKSYSLGRSTVRIFPETAIVSYNYTRQASIAGVPSDGDFVVTDVWVKRGDQWLAVSQHISSVPKP